MTHHDDFDLYKTFVNRPIIVMKYKVLNRRKKQMPLMKSENSSEMQASRACSSKAGE
ncbi:hypothetical protein Patl1_22592 [Pistacia atlantica]|uniref:Uncharacterized protein n=1 Tax=Pistacia atlantica TaxID=434234 RepID=A0ACC0ZXC7_9ROSI|nr:hypothetical protein Patl1_22592 [Pistacia atlantica]